MDILLDLGIDTKRYWQSGHFSESRPWSVLLPLRDRNFTVFVAVHYQDSSGASHIDFQSIYFGGETSDEDDVGLGATGDLRGTDPGLLFTMACGATLVLASFGHVFLVQSSGRAQKSTGRKVDPNGQE